VAFSSDASNLVSGDTNNAQDIFVHDRQTGETTRVSVASNGTQGNSMSLRFSISADGNIVAFDSFASNLVTVDTNNAQDIFVHDRGTNETTRVSVSSVDTTIDTDGDALPDIWETDGFDFDGDGVVDVGLPAMGADPNTPDIFVYVDWLEGQELGIFHSHEPNDGSIDLVVEAFARQGINLHVIFGQPILEADEVFGNNPRELGFSTGECNYSWQEFQVIKERNLPRSWWPIFHYVIFGHDLPVISCQGQQL
jgi:hypothetical protein